MEENGSGLFQGVIQAFSWKIAENTSYQILSREILTQQ
jgi:hypothetical protein